MTIADKEYGNYTVRKEVLVKLIENIEKLQLTERENALMEWVIGELDFKDNMERLRLLKQYPYYYCLNKIKNTNEYEVIRFSYAGISHKQALTILRKRYGLVPRVVGSSHHIRCLQDAGVHNFIDQQTKYNYWTRIDMYRAICGIDFDNENIIHYDLNPSQLEKG